MERAGNFGNPFELGVVLHWDGRTWTQVPTPLGDLHDVVPSGVVATSANSVWVIANGSLEAYGVAMHWDGRRWRIFHLRGPIAADEGGSLTLNSLTAAAARDIQVAATEVAPSEGADDDTWG